MSEVRLDVCFSPSSSFFFFQNLNDVLEKRNGRGVGKLRFSGKVEGYVERESVSSKV